jgi:hypothetical protein
VDEVTSFHWRVNSGSPSNKSLDASGGSVFRIMIGPAMLE